MKFCPSCGGIAELPAGMHLMNMHDRLCRCAQPAEAVESIPPSALTEEQVRVIVREEVAKALAAVKQEVGREAPQEIARQVRAKTGSRANK